MIPVKWGRYGLDALAAQRGIAELWDRGLSTYEISRNTAIPEPQVDRVITDHITRKRLRRPP